MGGGPFSGGGGPNLVEQDKQQERERKRIQEEQNKVKQELSGRQSSLKKEPPKEALDVVQIQINCPNGTKTKRRFLLSDKVIDVMNFVEAYDITVKKGSFYLRCNYPKKVYDKPNMTLKEVGMGKRENLFIQMKR